MNKNQIPALQNGSDIRGVAMEGVAGEPVNFSPVIASEIAKAFVHWLSRKLAKAPESIQISVGRDPRLSGPRLAEGILNGLVSMGCRAGDYGLSTTPAMFMSTRLEKNDGAIMITASHLPWNRNGMKFFYGGGGLEKQDITELLTLSVQGSFPQNPRAGMVHTRNFLTDYAGFLVNFIRKETASFGGGELPLEGLRILVDAGNGSGGFFASLVLGVLGADTTGSLFLEPDGHFPNHAPNPENSEALKTLQQAVQENKADLGIIFDTDVDRAAIVDSSGNVINRNKLIALISSIVLEKYPGTWIVTDSITSDGLRLFIEEKLGGHHYRFKRGYRNVINKAIQLNREGKACHLAIETSGHAALKENYFLDDGAFLVACILVKLAQMKKEQNKKLTSLIKDMPVPMEEKEFRFRIKTTDFADYGKKILAELTAFIQKQTGWSMVQPNYEGIRVACDRKSGNGWFLLRLSLHDPVMPLNVESNEKGGVDHIMKHLFRFLQKFDKLQ